MIGSESVIHRREDMPTVDLDGEIAMMNPEKGKYYGFDSIATRVWELIKEPVKFSSLIECLVSEYNVDRQTCECEVKELLDKLYKEDLIYTKEG